jgi:hypothetical protein
LPCPTLAGKKRFRYRLRKELATSEPNAAKMIEREPAVSLQALERIYRVNISDENLPEPQPDKEITLLRRDVERFGEHEVRIIEVRVK